MRVALFEDLAAPGFGPLVLTRPVFELLCGRYSLRERIVRHFAPENWAAFLRADLAESYRESQPVAKINDLQSLHQEPTLVINGRWLPTRDSLSEISEDNAGVIDGEVMWLTLDPLESALLTIDNWDEALPAIARTRTVVDAGGTLLKHPWDLVNANADQLIADFDFDDRYSTRPPDQLAVTGPIDLVRIHPTVQIDPYVVVDTTGGPVTIDEEACIQAFTRLEGPCHIGRSSRLFRANIRSGTTIGPHCRVGGEIEESILHGYVNKYHDGFLGHGYVCPWTNLGALTTNSDLKNDYSSVRVPLVGEPIDTGSVKVGCFIGDHTKTALGSLFNTGSSIGVMSMVLPGGELLPKHIPSFARVWHGRLAEPWEFDRYITIARVAMSRRSVELTSAAIRHFRRLYEQSSGERKAALQRQRERVRN